MEERVEVNEGVRQLFIHVRFQQAPELLAGGHTFSSNLRN